MVSARHEVSVEAGPKNFTWALRLILRARAEFLKAVASDSSVTTRKTYLARALISLPGLV